MRRKEKNNNVNRKEKNKKIQSYKTKEVQLKMKRRT